MYTRAKTYITENVQLVLTLDDIKKLLKDNSIAVSAKDDISLIIESDADGNERHRSLASGIHRVVFSVRRPLQVERS